MNAIYKLAASTVMITGMAASAIAQQAGPRVATVNLTEGQGAFTSSGNPSWDGLSEFVLIPGAALTQLGQASATTVLYLGFTGGTEADIGNMVIYATPRNGSTVTRVQKVTLGGTQSPQINLASTSVCPVQPVTVTNPCIVRLDPINLPLSAFDDYYFTVYFTLDTNNESISGVGQAGSAGALSGWYLYGDQTRIEVKGAIPTNENPNDNPPFFLVSVENQ